MIAGVYLMGALARLCRGSLGMYQGQSSLILMGAKCRLGVLNSRGRYEAGRRGLWPA